MLCIIVGYDVREPVEVRILKDRIEISSYPGLERSISATAMQNNNIRGKKYRNRRIGDFLKELKLTEGRNTGIPKIKRALENNGSPAPIFETDDDRTYFITTILMHEGFKTNPETTIETTTETTIEKLNDTQIKLLGLIKQNPSITLIQMANKLNLTREGIRYNINSLKNRNIISREGSTKKGKWIIETEQFSQATLQALQDTKNGKNLSKTFDNVDEMFEDLDKN